jgi:hypothetical protein
MYITSNSADWSKKWQMIFNPSKCYTLRITKGKQPVIYPYHMKGQVLESVNNNPYLGVELSSTLSWDTHIVLEVPVLAGLMLLSQDLLNIRA